MPARNRHAQRVGKTPPNAGHKIGGSVICSVRAIKRFKFVRTQRSAKAIRAINYHLITFVATLVSLVFNGFRTAEEISHRAMLYSTQ